MTTQEFSDAFDTLLSSYDVAANFGTQPLAFDEYEKSLFLTKAQEELVTSLYTGKNSYGESFESTEELRRYLASLVRERRLKPITNTSGMPLGMTTTSKFFTLPDGLWFITYEAVVLSSSKCEGKNILQVFPIKQDEYHSLRDNPFRGVNDRRALRLDLSEGVVEIICKYIVSEYQIRYIEKVSPIILINLPDGLTINGESSEMGCTLHKALHQKILDRAVVLAIQSKGYQRPSAEGK